MATKQFPETGITPTTEDVRDVIIDSFYTEGVEAHFTPRWKRMDVRMDFNTPEPKIVVWLNDRPYTVTIKEGR